MAHKLFWKTEAKQEFDSLNGNIKKRVTSQLKKLKEKPQLGKPLGNKMGMDLTGYRKLYFYNKKYRIVYLLDKQNEKVIIYSIGKRDDMAVYREMARRLKKIQEMDSKEK